MSSLPDNIDTVHREVQRKFGRNLLLLQQYEQLLKNLFAESNIAGASSDDILIKKAQRHESVSKKSLGQVIGDLIGSYITPISNRHISEENDELQSDLTQTSIRITYRMEFTEENFKLTKQKLADLVDLRNELVHHFLEKHDIMTSSGCQTAESYLDECFKNINYHYQELLQWIKHSDDSRAYMAALMLTPEFRDYFIHGIKPDKAGVIWELSTIVNLLRDAESALATEGWTSLHRAIAYIGKLESKQTPKRYGCSSWRQVLHESKQFEVRKEQAALGLTNETWYRSRFL
ncbi:MAG TPA: OST-HTH/LOTUS domain-containing protein [Gallionellaceae bacterium]|jgi:hypothetical protein|nr:OST-HTH/LOTUS domain-containing protein [Gallionellaceae bacterium]HQS75895.1 OST-HTH/LOTUS domain-containing protein [Gallionellaceae bacterium]